MLKLSSTTLRLNCTSENTATHNDYHILPILSEHFNNRKFRSFKINLDDLDCGIAVVTSTSLPIMPIPYADVIRVDSDTELSLSFHRVVELNYNLRGTFSDVLCLSNLEFPSMYSPSLNQFKN